MNHYQELENIAHDIGTKLARYGRIGVRQTKEKYGSVRVYCGFGVDSLHSLLYPRRAYKHSEYPDWLWSVDMKYISQAAPLINALLIPYQEVVYKLVYRLAIIKHPDQINAIVSGADYSELIDASKIIL